MTTASQEDRSFVPCTHVLYFTDLYLAADVDYEHQ